MENMEEMLEQNDDVKKLSPGDIVQGKVVSVGKDEVFVDINYKSEGVIPRAEMALNPPEDLALVAAPGDGLAVMVLDPDKEGGVLLSKVKADAQTALEKLNAIYESKEIIDVFIDAAVKGGVTCEVFGLRGFIPASHTGLERVEDLSVFVGQRLPAQIIELSLDGPRKKVILSRRDLLRQDRAEKEKEFYTKIAAGEKYSGVVSRLADFGAFIDLGGVDGLLHVSEMSWQKVKHPADVLAVNDKIEVLVKKVDAENKKISLSLRDLLEDPWLSGIGGLKEGQIVSGKVTQTTKFGAFVRLNDTVEGLVHVSEIAEERVESPEAVLKAGDEVRVKILKIDKKNKKVSLSIAKAKKEEGRLELKEFIGDNSEFRTSIGSKFDLNKIFD
jgi:4-hydroxy-3-methylbut-2-enyl diphosphate reductase